MDLLARGVRTEGMRRVRADLERRHRRAVAEEKCTDSRVCGGRLLRGWCGRWPLSRTGRDQIGRRRFPGTLPGTTGCAPTRSRGTLFLWKRPSFLLTQLEVVVEAQGRWPGPARRCQGRGTHDTRHGEAKRHCWARQGRAGRDLSAGEPQGTLADLVKT